MYVISCVIGSSYYTCNFLLFVNDNKSWLTKYSFIISISQIFGLINYDRQNILHLTFTLYRIYFLSSSLSLTHSFSFYVSIYLYVSHCFTLFLLLSSTYFNFYIKNFVQLYCRLMIYCFNIVVVT